MAIIRGFSGKYRFLSNFYQHPIILDGITYPSSEHAFAAGKTKVTAERVKMSQMETSRDVKAYGRKIQLREGWNEGIAFMVMSQVLAVKFADPQLRELLADTNYDLLVETNKWHDNRWGDCTCERSECAATGTNLLGIALMTLREGLFDPRNKELM